MAEGEAVAVAMAMEETAVDGEGRMARRVRREATVKKERKVRSHRRWWNSHDGDPCLRRTVPGWKTMSLVDVWFFMAPNLL